MESPGVFGSALPNRPEERECSLIGWHQCREYIGNAAARPIGRRLSDWPKAQSIASQVIVFYGDYLRYHENPILFSSLYEIRLRHEPIGLKYVRIDLQLGTNRIAEALTHELLHLHIGMLGYPLGEAVWIPAGLVPCADYVMGIHTVVGNLLQHELIFDAFMDLGFEEERFLSSSTPIPNYEAIALDLLRSRDYAVGVGFPWWCLEYFRHWSSMRHGAGGQSSAYAERALYWGSKVHPEMTKATEDVCRIVSSGALRNIKEYPAWANSLLELMGLPKYTQWVSLRAERNGSPLAVKI